MTLSEPDRPPVGVGSESFITAGACAGLARLQERGLAAPRRLDYRWTMILRVLFSLLACACPGLGNDLRSWTLPDGRKLNARISGIEGGKVLLMPSNGSSPVPVLTQALRGTDRAVVDAWVPPGRRTAGTNVEITRNPAGWPITVVLKEDPAFTVVEEDRNERRYIYRSDHFEFSSRERLNNQIVREFSRQFELTFETVAALPLQLDPEAPRGYFKVVLYSTHAEYQAAGGPKESGGLYRGSTGEVMVPLPALGVERVGDRWKMQDRRGNQPLLHEVTHQVMGPWLTVLPMWLIEGMAEYVGAGRYSVRRLTLHSGLDNVFAFLRDQMGVPDRKIDMRHPQRLMVMNFEKWQGDLAASSSNGIKNYYSAMLLFYYFAHLDGDGTGRKLMAYFKARVASRTPDDDTADRDRHLLRGRSWEKLWEDLARAFAPYKIKLS